MSDAHPRQRSPNYPNLSLQDAIVRVQKVFDRDRRAPLDREVVAKHMGYSGLSGASDKTLASIMQYGLLERVAKGEIRVSQLAMDIFHPDKPEDKLRAIAIAGNSPAVFKTLRDRFGDAVPSRDALHSFLVRQNYMDHAINLVISAYTETCQFLQQQNAFESGGTADAEHEESIPEEQRREDRPVKGDDRDRPKEQERKKMEGERTLTKGLLSKESNFEILVSGKVGVKEIERLIQKLELDKEILADESDDED